MSKTWQNPKRKNGGYSANAAISAGNGSRKGRSTGNAQRDAGGAAATDKAGWACNRADCKRPEHKLNFGDRVTCNWCNTAKSAAMSPPKEERRGYVAPGDAKEAAGDKAPAVEDHMSEEKKAWLADENGMLKAIIKLRG